MSEGTSWLFALKNKSRPVRIEARPIREESSEPLKNASAFFSCRASWWSSRAESSTRLSLQINTDSIKASCDESRLAVWSKSEPKPSPGTPTFGAVSPFSLIRRWSASATDTPCRDTSTSAPLEIQVEVELVFLHFLLPLVPLLLRNANFFLGASSARVDSTLAQSLSTSWMGKININMCRATTEANVQMCQGVHGVRVR